jgi:hypothetical protein
VTSSFSGRAFPPARSPVAAVTRVPCRTRSSRTSSTSRPSSHSPRPRTASASLSASVWGLGGQGRTVIQHRRLDHLVGDVEHHLDRLPPPDPYRMALVAASFSAQDDVVGGLAGHSPQARPGGAP